MGRLLYDDGVYTVTPAIVSTPRRFYPLAHTTASIRRDPLWAAIAFAAFGAACLGVYGDLLHFHEQATLVIFCACALAAGSSVSVRSATAAQ
jgi:hypothetical protein